MKWTDTERLAYIGAHGYQFTWLPTTPNLPEGWTVQDYRGTILAERLPLAEAADLALDAAWWQVELGIDPK